MSTHAPPQQQRHDRSKATAQAKATQTMHAATHVGPNAESQLRLGQLLGGGPRAAAQLRLARMVTQRQEVDEEETTQLQAATNEDVVQGVFWYRQYIDGPTLYYAGPEAPLASWQYVDTPTKRVYYPFGLISPTKYSAMQSKLPPLGEAAQPSGAGAQIPAPSSAGLAFAGVVPQTSLSTSPLVPFLPQRPPAPTPRLDTPQISAVAVAQPSMPAITFPSLRKSLDAWGGNKRMNHEARANALIAFDEILTLHPKPNPDEIAPIVEGILAGQRAYIQVRGEQGSGTVNQRGRREAAETAITDGVRRLQGVKAGEEKTVLPSGIIYDPAPQTVMKESEEGVKFEIGVHFGTTTGYEGAKRGEDAGGSPASNYLRAKYPRSSVEFVAGHLVTRKAGGPARTENLAPFTNDFNTGPMREPESYAERLLRSELLAPRAWRATKRFSVGRATGIFV